MSIPLTHQQLTFIRGHDAKLIALDQQIRDVRSAMDMFLNYVLAEAGAKGPHKLSDDGTKLVRDEDPTKKNPPKPNQTKRPTKRTRR